MFTKSNDLTNKVSTSLELDFENYKIVLSNYSGSTLDQAGYIAKNLSYRFSIDLPKGANPIFTKYVRSCENEREFFEVLLSIAKIVPALGKIIASSINEHYGESISLKN